MLSLKMKFLNFSDISGISDTINPEKMSVAGIKNQKLCTTCTTISLFVL